jgi:hypothetical protein
MFCVNIRNKTIIISTNKNLNELVAIRNKFAMNILS